MIRIRRGPTTKIKISGNQKIKQVVVNKVINKVEEKEVEPLKEILKKNYTKFISLGYNCFPKKFLKEKIEDRETDYFDYVGTSMWTINELIKNNFYEGTNQLYNKDDYTNLIIKVNNKKIVRKVVTNKKYYLRFLHDLEEKDLVEEEKFKTFVEKYNRREKRFMEMLDTQNNNKGNILFIRLEELKSNRIIYREHKSIMKIKEIKQIKEFNKIIKSKWENLRYKIIYLSTSEKTRVLKDENIIILNTGRIIRDYEKSDEIISSILEQHRNILEQVN
jgi:hypothetical protein